MLFYCCHTLYRLIIMQDKVIFSHQCIEYINKNSFVVGDHHTGLWIVDFLMRQGIDDIRHLS